MAASAMARRVAVRASNCDDNDTPVTTAWEDDFVVALGDVVESVGASPGGGGGGGEAEESISVIRIILIT